MKNKFIIFTLCFTIIFTSINFSNYKAYANNYEPLVFDGGVITAPMVATISSLAVASGIVLSSDDDIYDIARVFYEENKSNWEDVKNLFDLSVSIGSNKVVTVGKDFLELVKNTFNKCFTEEGKNFSSYGIPIGKNNAITYSLSLVPPTGTSSSDYDVLYEYAPGVSLIQFRTWISTSSNYAFNIYFANGSKESINSGGSISKTDFSKINKVSVYQAGTTIYFLFLSSTNSTIRQSTVSLTNYDKFNEGLGSYDIPYVPGAYNQDVLSKDSIDINVPSNVSDLIGVGSSDVLGNPSYEIGGNISLPGISNPSIDSTLEGTFNPSFDSDVPGTSNPSIPDEGIWSTIKDFIISLVVPSDTFWTDTFNSFRDNLNKNFPMLDMSKFDSLLVNGKPFPNIYAYGSKIVDGDVINSIVDWLRPIIAGFIMICLMFFNYRKVYKIIRNSEPFGNIAPGTSDFSTGLSSADIKQIVADAKIETERRTYRR